MYISSYEMEMCDLENKRKVTLHLNGVSNEEYIKLSKLCNPGDTYRRTSYDSIREIFDSGNSIYGLTSAKFASHGKENKNMVPYIKKVIFNNPATIVFWSDGTKTVAKAHGEDKFDKEVGLTVCIAKKAMGNKKKWDQVFKKWIK